MTRGIGLALASGALLACAFPPFHRPELAWVGLVPLLVAVRRAASPRRAFACGLLAGAVFFLLIGHPLVSAHAWSGWISESPAEYAGRLGRQWRFLHAVWLGFSLWCALAWGAWAAALHVLGRRGPQRFLAAAVGGWVLLAEWLRSQMASGSTWGFLGNALADVPPLRQLASLGGVWLLSALVVAVNVAVTQLLQARSARDRRTPAAVALLFFAAWAWGTWAAARPLAPGAPLTAAVLHYHKSEDYILSDYSALGLDRGYAPLIQQALRLKPDLLVLPESVVLGAVTLDGTHSRAKPKSYETLVDRWDAEAKRSLAGTPTTLVIGMDTVEGGRDHNTLVVWGAEGGRLGAYHKRVLVWFSETSPPGWPRGMLRGRTDYAPGAGSQLIRAGRMALGGSICQEVVHPSLFRESVRDGATLLVSGAQDGVFADPAVAAVQADLAQLRAVEAGRYLVRAVKDGVSAIIDPSGRELVRSGGRRLAAPALPSATPPAGGVPASVAGGILTAAVHPLSGLTPYARFGDWVVAVSALLLLWLWTARRA